MHGFGLQWASEMGFADCNDGNSLHMAVAHGTSDEAEMRWLGVLASMICLDNNMCLSYVPRSVTSARAPACYMLYYYCYICMCV